MLPWLTRRLVTSLLLVLLVLSAVFWVVHLAPGDPLDQVVQEGMTDADRDLIRQRLGLDAGVGEQWLEWLGGALTGDWGTSLRQQRPVAEILAEAVPATLLLTLTAYALHLVLAVGVSLLTATRRGGALDHALQGIGLALYSLPAFWLGLMLILVCGRLLGWLPTSGMRSPDAQFLSTGARLADLLRHLILPAATLALGSFMGTARYVRAALDETLAQDHILAARARGVPERRILVNHALRGALLPLLTLLGLHLPFLLGGAVVIETVFGWPGMGRVAVEAIWARDYPVIMATTAVSAVLVVAGSLLADLLYRAADPRVRLAGRRGA